MCPKALFTPFILCFYNLLHFIVHQLCHTYSPAQIWPLPMTTRPTQPRFGSSPPPTQVKTCYAMQNNLNVNVLFWKSMQR